MTPLPATNLGVCVVKGEGRAPLVGSLRNNPARPQKLHIETKGSVTLTGPGERERGPWARAVTGACGGGHRWPLNNIGPRVDFFKK